MFNRKLPLDELCSLRKPVEKSYLHMIGWQNVGLRIVTLLASDRVNIQKQILG